MSFYLNCGCEVSEISKRMVEPCRDHSSGTLRDLFAAQALDTIFGQNWTNESLYADVARRCGLMADAMMTERERAK